MKITKVYTRTGDKGLTSLVGGQRVSKASTRLEAYGTVDELSSHLGLLASLLPTDSHEYQMVVRIQTCLFNVCTNLATDQSQTPLYPSAHLPEGEIELLEQEVDTIMHELPEPQGFILPGGCQEAQYINRLSDYLFVLAKKLNFLQGIEEKIWQNVCK